jgi:hypothetical protein
MPKVMKFIPLCDQKEAIITVFNLQTRKNPLKTRVLKI